MKGLASLPGGGTHAAMKTAASQGAEESGGESVEVPEWRKRRRREVIGIATPSGVAASSWPRTPLDYLSRCRRDALLCALLLTIKEGLYPRALARSRVYQRRLTLLDRSQEGNGLRVATSITLSILLRNFIDWFVEKNSNTGIFRGNKSTSKILFYIDFTLFDRKYVYTHSVVSTIFSIIIIST